MTRLIEFIFYGNYFYGFCVLALILKPAGYWVFPVMNT